MSFSDYMENKVLSVLAGTTFTAPTTLYFALFTTAPADAGTGGVEVTGNAYARVAVTAATGMTVSGTNPTQVVNNASVDFPIATGSWGTVAAAGIYDASTGGNLIHYGTLTASKTIASGDQFRFTSSQYKITLD